MSGWVFATDSGVDSSLQHLNGMQESEVGMSSFVSSTMGHVKLSASLMARDRVEYEISASIYIVTTNHGIVTRVARAILLIGVLRHHSLRYIKRIESIHVNRVQRLSIT